VAIVVAILLATPLLSVNEVGAWTYAQAQEHVNERLEPLIERLLESLQPEVPAAPTTTTAPPAAAAPGA
jgi:hypothetical protein